MHIIGVDLAWSPTGKGWTGICVAQPDGSIVESCRVKTNDEIVARLERYTSGPCVVAVDAPLIVNNLTGSRPAERELTADFGKYDAGAYPANRDNELFKSVPRGAAIAEALGLSLTPSFSKRGAVRECIEVYPHPATIALFGLKKTLKYKAKKGRTKTHRAAERLSLIELIEGAGTDPALDVAESSHWKILRASFAVHGSSERIEDEVDAYLCALIGLWYWVHDKSRSRMYGDVESGYIVTPQPG